MVVGVPLIFKGQPSIADVVEILQPLEIRHRHTASVQVHVLQDQTSQVQTSACLDFTPRGWKMILISFPLYYSLRKQNGFPVVPSTHRGTFWFVFPCVCSYTYRNNHDVVLQEDLVSVWCGWTIGTFSNDLKQTKHQRVTHKCDPEPCEFWGDLTTQKNTDWALTLALILGALSRVSCFSPAAGIRMWQSASKMFPS